MSDYAKRQESLSETFVQIRSNAPTPCDEGCRAMKGLEEGARLALIKEECGSLGSASFALANAKAELTALVSMAGRHKCPGPRFHKDGAPGNTDICSMTPLISFASNIASYGTNLELEKAMNDRLNGDSGAGTYI